MLKNTIRLALLAVIAATLSGCIIYSGDCDTNVTTTADEKPADLAKDQ